VIQVKILVVNYHQKQDDFKTQKEQKFHIEIIMLTE
jgi:hypothetical protein